MIREEIGLNVTREKKNLTVDEINMGIKTWRPSQLVIELTDTLPDKERGFRISGAICYDATDLSLAADLKNITDAFLVPALNQDVDTFDTMVDALHYHMFQHVVLVNTGEFGGSAAKAPYKEKYHKRIAHAHGPDQIAIITFDMNMSDFTSVNTSRSAKKELKTQPAGLTRLD